MNKVRAIAIEEQRQLITFGFAVMVFLMTLFALRLHDDGTRLGRAGIADRERVSHAMRQGAASIPGDRTVALTARILVWFSLER